MMFIHGGGFTTGGEAVPYQIPAQWVQRSQDLIVVSFKYVGHSNNTCDCNLTNGTTATASISSDSLMQQDLMTRTLAYWISA